MSTDETQDPSNPMTNYHVMSPRWFMTEALLGGTEAMRSAGEEFLPRHPRERDDAYEERIKKAVLYNVYEVTLNLLSDKPFTDQVTVKDDNPQELKDMMEDVDLMGNDITQFSHDVFRKALAKGFTHVMVDAPPENPDIKTLADERAAGVRPYLVHVDPENIIFMETRRINGEEVCVHLRMRDIERTRVGFAEVENEYIREYNLTSRVDPDTLEEEFIVTVTRWSEQKDKRRKTAWTAERMPDINADRIPIYTFYTVRDGLMLSKPPLQDLAYMQVEHFQSYSDQINILTVSRFPILAASGISEYDTGATVVGPRNMLTAEDPGARFYYVEHSGAAIEAGDKHVKGLESKMAIYGAQLLQKRPDRETAQAQSRSEEAFTSPLQRMARSFEDYMLKVLMRLADMRREGAGEEVTGIEVKQDYTAENVDAVELQTLQVAAKEGLLSRRGLLEELKNKGVLSPDFDVDADFANIRAEIELKAAIANAGKPTKVINEPPNDDPDIPPPGTEET